MDMDNGVGTDCGTRGVGVIGAEESNGGGGELGQL